jgi:prefoldin subunit 1
MTLRHHVQILLQIQQSAVTANRNLNATKAQIAGKERERRIVQLTATEISDLASDANVYQGVGKAFGGLIFECAGEYSPPN